MTPRPQQASSARWLAATVVVVATLGGCVTTTDRDRTPADRSDPILRQIGASLPGEYTTSLDRQQRLHGQESLSLHVRRQSVAEPDALAFVLTQHRGDDPPRAFLLGLERTGDNGLRGVFAPLDASGQVNRQCDMEFIIRNDGFSGQSNPRQCRFGEGEQATGLLKEIAFDGSQLVIGDRLMRLADGEPMARDQIHAFYRIRQFAGWGGRLENGDWRLASDFQLHSGNDYLEPADAAGMDLGIGLELSRHSLGGDAGQILRLTVTDRTSGAILAQSWADPEAEAIGVALPDLQIGLEAVDR